MKKYNPKLKNASARRHKIITEPTRLSDLNFDELYSEISDKWQEKSKRLQARRWRKIKHQTA